MKLFKLAFYVPVTTLGKELEQLNDRTSQISSIVFNWLPPGFMLDSGHIVGTDGDEYLKIGFTGACTTQSAFIDWVNGTTERIANVIVGVQLIGFITSMERNFGPPGTRVIYHPLTDKAVAAAARTTFWDEAINDSLDSLRTVYRAAEPK